MDATRLFAGLRNAGLLRDVHTVVGGKLGIQGRLADSQRHALLAAGADEVLGEDTESLRRAVSTAARRATVVRIPSVA